MQFIINILGPFGPFYIAGGVGLALVIWSLIAFGKSDAIDQLDKIKEQMRNDRSGAGGERYSGTFFQKISEMAKAFEPQKEEDILELKLMMVHAGYRAKNAASILLFAQVAIGIIGVIIGVLYAYLQSRIAPLSTASVMMYIIIPGAIAYLFPKRYVKNKITARKNAIEDAFPDSLDMMLVCVEAGQSMDQAILKVASELKSGYPELASEFAVVSQELKAGKERAEVLRDMAWRTGVHDVSSFVTVLIQSQQFGSSIGDALRVYSDEMRDKRVMRAEERANQLPTKMTLATMLLTLPPLLIILLGPSVYGMILFFNENAASF